MSIKKYSFLYPLLLVLILLLGTALRTLKFPDIPPGFNQDESASAYEAFSLLETGKDRWGNKWPAYFPSWGSGQSVLPSYLSIPFIKAFGLNVFSARLVLLIFSLLSLPLFFIALRPLGRFTAYLGVFMLAIIPWHFMMSRWGLECNLMPFFMLLGCYTLSQALIKEQQRWIIPSLIPFALALYSYGTTILILPVFFLFIILYFYKQLQSHFMQWIQALALFLILSFPFFIYFIENYLLKQNLSWTDHLFFSTPLCPSTRLSQIEFTNWGEMVTQNKNFLISGFNDNTCYNLVPGKPLLFIFAIPVMILGFIVASFQLWGSWKAPSTKSGNTVLAIFLFWGLASFSLFFLFELNVNRFNHFYLPCIALSAWVLFFITSKIRHTIIKRSAQVLIIAGLAITNGLIAKEYFTAYPKGDIRIQFGKGMGDAFNALNQLPELKQIRITNHVALPYVHTLFFMNYPPHKFQQEVSFEIVNGEYKVNSFGKYIFYEEFLIPGQPYGYLSRKNEYIPSANQKKTVFFTNELWEVGIIEPQ